MEGMGREKKYLHVRRSLIILACLWKNSKQEHLHAHWKFVHFLIPYKMLTYQTSVFIITLWSKWKNVVYSLSHTLHCFNEKWKYFNYLISQRRVSEYITQIHVGYPSCGIKDISGDFLIVKRTYFALPKTSNFQSFSFHGILKRCWKCQSTPSFCCSWWAHIPQWHY